MAWVKKACVSDLTYWSRVNMFVVTAAPASLVVRGKEVPILRVHVKAKCGGIVISACPIRIRFRQLGDFDSQVV